MQVKLSKNNIYAFLVCLLCVMISACESSKRIKVSDDSTLVSSRKEFFDSLYNSINYKRQNINSYISKKVTLVSDKIPIYNSLNASLYFASDSIMVSKLYLPFPVIEVAKFRIVNSFFEASSKTENSLNLYKSVPDDLLPNLCSIFLGSTPESYKLFDEADFSNFSLYIENNKYVLYRKELFIELKIVINQDMSLHSFYGVYDNISLSVKCSDYSLFSNFNLPKTLDISLNQGTNQYNLVLNIKNIQLNSALKLEY